MQSISAPVGEGATNAIHDVALVQAILLKLKRPTTAKPPGVAYLTSYDGTCGTKTVLAIRAFQANFVSAPAGGTQSAPPLKMTAGQVKPGDATWTKLISQVPAAFANLRALSGGKIVYVQASGVDRDAKLAALGSMTFNAAFRSKVQACINQMHALHGIAIGVCPREGDRRTFQAQYQLFLRVPSVTHAGPGESNHNFGMAVDLGFERLQWLHSDGSIDIKETPWLHHLTAKGAAEANRFWAVLRTVGTSSAIGAFRGPVADQPHLQNWNDALVSTPLRLAAHLQASGTMKWSYATGSYRCDLGYGGAMYAVGKAVQIWNLNATVTAANITEARKHAAAQSPGVIASPATAADVIEMHQELRRQFDLADQNWQGWTAT